MAWRCTVFGLLSSCALIDCVRDLRVWDVIMGISLEVYRYRIGCFASVVGHGHAVGPAADLTSLSLSTPGCAVASRLLQRKDM